MAGIFPRNGLAPGVDNSGIPLVNEPAEGCDALYYNEACAQKVDPRALNAMISEVVSVVNACPGITYDCSRPDNLLRALACTAVAPGGGGGLVNVQWLTASGTYTKSPNTTRALVISTGGGGGGGGMGGVGTGGGGGAGSTAIAFVDLSALTTVAVTIGAGGAGGIGTAYGNNGGVTSFGSFAVAGGGFGASPDLVEGADSTNGAGGTGGTATAGLILLGGSAGHSGSVVDGGTGGSSFWGGGGAPGADVPSAWGRSAGQSGTAPGAGGGGGDRNNGGNGAAGAILVLEFAAI